MHGGWVLRRYVSGSQDGGEGVGWKGEGGR